MKYGLIIATLIGLCSCNKDELGPQYVGGGSSGKGSRILVLNEGNFGWSNSSLSILYTDSVEVENQVFLNANGYALGDVAQSAVRIGQRLFVVVNNSGKIEVLDTNSFESIGTISGFNSPRYCAQISPSKAYVSDLYSNSIQIIDPSNLQITGSIAVSGWTESISVLNGRVYVSMPDTHHLLVIDPGTDQIMDTLMVRKGSGSLLQDVNGVGWLLCSGGLNEELPVLYSIDLQSNEKLDSLEFTSTSESPGNLQINAFGDSLYFLNEHVYSMSVNALTLPSSPIYASTGQTFYSIYADPIDPILYVSDVKDYIQNSTIYQLSSSGNLIKTYNTGVISGNMLRP